MSADISSQVGDPATWDIASARQLAAADGISLTAALSKQLGLSTAAVAEKLAQATGYPYWRGEEFDSVAPWFSELTYTECLRRGVWIGKDMKGQAWALLPCAFDEASESWVTNRLRDLGHEVCFAVADPSLVSARMAAFEAGLKATAVAQELSASEEGELVAAEISLASLEDESSDVVRFVNSTLYDALKQQASDMHFESEADGLRVLFRLDGVLAPVASAASRARAEQIVSRLKVMAELDISERRVPQDGRFKVRINSRTVDFRVSVMPSIVGEDVVLRLLDRQALVESNQTLTLDDLGLTKHSKAAIRRLAVKPHGMLLVTGPTGSGKTTTLYAALSEINTGRDKIVTIEDPVEYRLPKVLQIPVNERKGLTFAKGLRSILRHDPDKIMVGEIRDEETAQIAVQAALTGHLVLTTVHANNVFDVLGRFLHMGVDAYSLAAALNGIVSQRLLRMNCTACAVEVQPDPVAADLLELSQHDLVPGASWRAGAGCPSCRGTGFKGRRAAVEVLTLDDTFKELIAARATVARLKAHAATTGLQSLRDVALEWARAGLTTLDEVARVAG